MPRAKKIYISEMGGIGGDPTRDTAAFQKAYDRCPSKGDMVVVDKSKTGLDYYVNENVLAAHRRAASPYGVGGLTKFLHPATVFVQQILPDGHRWKGTGRKTNDPNEGGGTIRASASFVMPADGSRSMVREGPDTTAYVSGTRCEDLHFANNGAPGLIGVYGDRLQEQCGLYRCSFQGFRQAAKFPYAVTTGTGRNANFQLLDNELYNVAETATTLAADAVATDVIITIAQNADGSGRLRLNNYEYIAIQLNDTSWHYAFVVLVAGTTITIYPELPGDADSGNAILHTAPSLDAYSGAGLLMLRNTVFAYPATHPIAPAVRLWGNKIKVSDLHTESCMAAVLLGGFAENFSGTAVTQGIELDTIGNNNHAVTPGCDVIRVENRDASAFTTSQHKVRSCKLENIFQANTCVNLVNDLGSGSGGSGREACVLDVATYGSCMMEPYIIGDGYPSASFGPRTFVGNQEGRINVTIASGNTDDFDPTYGKYFRVTPNADNTSAIRSILGYRFGRELFFTNIASSASGDIFTMPHNATGNAQGLWSDTNANLIIAPQETAWVRYGIGPQSARWLVSKIGVSTSRYVTIAYSASMTANASLGDRFVITATNNTAYVIEAPTDPVLGKVITYTIRATAAGTNGTWNAIFKMAAWADPADGFSHSISFSYNGTNWTEVSRTPTQIPN